ncbi:hypothetical protein BaRGS_00039785 [Batillaria attramentaria]|uniref:Uncharacterized protein n=1 Tax=Batillaria attramentaria TaxID=370345 RepID=A0ABD0J263_9CAEN
MLLESASPVSRPCQLAQNSVYTINTLLSCSLGWNKRSASDERCREAGQASRGASVFSVQCTGVVCGFLKECWGS